MPYHHRLNGSSSPVLTATPRSYGKGQIPTPYQIRTPERRGMKFGTVDYVLEISPHNKFDDDQISGGFWVNMWNIRCLLLSLFFPQPTWRPRPRHLLLSPIDVWDEGAGGIREKYFSGKNHVKFGHFVNFSCIYYRAKMSCPQSWLSSYAYAQPGSWYSFYHPTAYDDDKLNVCVCTLQFVRLERHL